MRDSPVCAPVCSSISILSFTRVTGTDLQGGPAYSIEYTPNKRQTSWWKGIIAANWSNMIFLKMQVKRIKWIYIIYYLMHVVGDTSTLTSPKRNNLNRN